ncbi:MAG: hypothetical protein PHV63_00730 [Candidatus Daviesbacteria bacterium]|nr:hypothetical protein [Candidatus Daviesbacteria bacterium]
MTAENPFARLPKTARLADYGDYRILGYAERDREFNRGVLLRIASQIEEGVFGVTRAYAMQDIAFNLRNGGSMTVVVDSETGEPFGYSSQRVLAPTLEGDRRTIMFTSTRAINEKFQGGGIGPETLRFSFNMHGAPDIVAGIMGWSPPVIAYYKSGVVAELEGQDKEAAEAGIEPSGDDELDGIMKQIVRVKLYPFCRPYDKSSLMNEALKYVLQQSRYRGIPFDPGSGLMKGLWDKDSSMLFRVEKASRRVEVIGGLLRDKFNCDPTTGDAIVVMGPKAGWRAFLD